MMRFIEIQDKVINFSLVTCVYVEKTDLIIEVYGKVYLLPYETMEKARVVLKRVICKLAERNGEYGKI